MRGRKKFFRFDADFQKKKIAADERNLTYRIGTSGDVLEGTPEIRWKDIVFVKDASYVYTHGTTFPAGGMSQEDKQLLALIATEIEKKIDKTDIADWAKEENKPSYTASEVGALPSSTTHLSGDIPTSEKGASGGVATLDESGKVPSSQLPSYVDDVLEFADDTYFPRTGEEGKIYIDISTNKTYRWGGTVYVPIGSDLAIGDTSSTAYAGDKGKKLEEDIVKKADKTDVTALETHLEQVERTVANILNEFDIKYNK